MILQEEKKMDLSIDIAERNVGPIDNTESRDSKLTSEEARAFFVDDEEVKPEEKPKEEEQDDDDDMVGNNIHL